MVHKFYTYGRFHQHVREAFLLKKFDAFLAIGDVLANCARRLAKSAQILQILGRKFRQI
jgi:hypothetical protein